MDIRTMAVLAVLTLAATGCGVSAPAAPTGAGGATTGPKVQRVVWASELPAAIANNPRMLCCNDHHQLRPIYENLIGIDAATGKQVPQLATA